jgi:hypothetical protein
MRRAGDDSDAPDPPSPEPVPLAYAVHQPLPKPAPDDWHFRLTWSVLLLVGIALFGGGLWALLAGDVTGHGAYVLLFGIPTVAAGVAALRSSNDL